MTCQLAAERLDNKTRWRGGRVVECAGLENRYGLTPIGGSNPPLSATDFSHIQQLHITGFYTRLFRLLFSDF
jgi:hypothetical protein